MIQRHLGSVGLIGGGYSYGKRLKHKATRFMALLCAILRGLIIDRGKIAVCLYWNHCIVSLSLTRMVGVREL